MTESPNFKKWFGGSKVVDSDGRPKLMFHGTPFEKEIKKFKPGVGGELGKGLYFTPMKEAAYLFGKNVYSVYLSAIPYEISLFRKNPKKESLFLAEKIIEAGKIPSTLKDISAKELAKRIQNTWGEDSYKFWVEKAGFDALMDAESQIPGQVMVFDSTQVKSATNNSGGWDANNPDITK